VGALLIRGRWHRRQEEHVAQLRLLLTVAIPQIGDLLERDPIEGLAVEQDIPEAIGAAAAAAGLGIG